MRQPKPWFRNDKNAWYVQIGKRQISLGKDQDEAFRRYHRLMAEEGLVESLSRTRTEWQVTLICDLYLEHSSRRHKPATYDLNRLRLQDFCDHYGGLSISNLKPFHLNRWLDSHDWGQSTRSGAIAIVKAAINFAVGQGYIGENPLRSVKKPGTKRRERLLTADEQSALLDATHDREFRDFLVALQETGARPGEVAAVTARDVDFDAAVWVLTDHKTRHKTGRPRVIYLTPCMIELCRRLVEAHLTGELFRNTHGKPWTRNAIRCRFRRLRDKLGLGAGVVAYTFRHTWTTEALERGVPIATVAELLGHSDTTMVSEHYSHLHEKHAHLKAAVRSARPSEP
jgi:integrase